MKLRLTEHAEHITGAGAHWEKKALSVLGDRRAGVQSQPPLCTSVHVSLKTDYGENVFFDPTIFTMWYQKLDQSTVSVAGLNIHMPKGAGRGMLASRLSSFCRVIKQLTCKNYKTIFIYIYSADSNTLGLKGAARNKPLHYLRTVVLWLCFSRPWYMCNILTLSIVFEIAGVASSVENMDQNQNWTLKTERNICWIYVIPVEKWPLTCFQLWKSTLVWCFHEVNFLMLHRLWNFAKNKTHNVTSDISHRSFFVFSVLQSHYSMTFLNTQ